MLKQSCLFFFVFLLLILHSFLDVLRLVVKTTFGARRIFYIDFVVIVIVVFFSWKESLVITEMFFVVSLLILLFLLSHGFDLPLFLGSLRRLTDTFYSLC